MSNKQRYSGLSSLHINSTQQNQEMASEDSESSNKAIRKSAQVTGHDFIPHFKIPVRKEQLCDEPANENQFFVKDRINLNNLSEDRVLEEIERVSNKIGGNGSSCL